MVSGGRHECRHYTMTMEAIDERTASTAVAALTSPLEISSTSSTTTTTTTATTRASQDIMATTSTISSNVNAKREEVAIEPFHKEKKIVVLALFVVQIIVVLMGILAIFVMVGRLYVYFVLLKLTNNNKALIRFLLI